MNRFIKRYFRFTSLLIYSSIIVCIILSHSGCNKDECTTPLADSITLRDSTWQIIDLVPGYVYTVHGLNLKDYSSVYINSTKLNPLYILATDTSIVFRMPNMETNSATDDLSDSVLVVKECGNALLRVNILLAPPYITKISNEYALGDDIITLEGYYFNLLESAVFPGGIEGEIVPEYIDTVCQLIVPEGVTEDGEIELTSKSGPSSSRIGVKFRDATGLLCNFDDVDTWEGWGGRVISNGTDEFIPDANGDFYAGEANNIAPGTDSIDQLILPVSLFEMPDFNGSLSPSYFNLKFETYTKYPWEHGYYRIELGKLNEEDEIEFAYTYDFQPWNDTLYNGSFSVEYWETYNIPLSEFRLITNNEIPIQSYGQIRVANYMKWMFMNPSEEEDGALINQFCIALDNFRIVQVISEEL